jgi:RimJ/RimL family protein N-acetyltransferase
MPHAGTPSSTWAWQDVAVADELVTPRLRLRPWRSDDLAALYNVFARPEVWRFPFGRGLSRLETEAFLARRIEEQTTRGWTEWAAEDRDSDRLVGYIGLAVPEFLPELMPAVEIGWRLDPDVWGRGLATEGARAALAHGFSVIGLDEVVSIYQPENVASGCIMIRLGMHFDRDTRLPGHEFALRVYRLSRAEWENRSGGAGSTQGDDGR